MNEELDVTTANALFYRWEGNHPSFDAEQVEIEDDSLRDGLQGAFLKMPSVAERLTFIRMTANIGCTAVMLGFPGAGEEEFVRCDALLEGIRKLGLKIQPRFLARALAEDLFPILSLREKNALPVVADFFINASPLRQYVEKWNLESQLDKIVSAIDFCQENELPFNISIEDASRTPPGDLRCILKTITSGSPQIITLCDTAGEATNHAASALVRFTINEIKNCKKAIKIAWHGHNDLGLALSNSIAALESGAISVSGSFLGIGERTGNTALEQIIIYLQRQGASRFKTEQLPELCRFLASITDYRVSENAPVIGSQAFATSTGTHAAALLKARRIGREHEDYLFSALPAYWVGRDQTILLGPNCGAASVRYMLEKVGIASNEQMCSRVLTWAKKYNGWLNEDDVRDYLIGINAEGQSSIWK